MSYLDSLEKEIQQWRSSSLLRSLRYEPGLLDFSSNDYLCLNRDGSHSELLNSLIAGTGGDNNVTVGSTGSRLIRGHWPSFESAEDEFNLWTGTPASLLFQSGYNANVGALSALTGPGDLVFCDRLCHASLLDGVRLSGAQKIYFNHNDLNHLESLLAGKKARRRKWILSESVFSMDGDVPDLKGILDLCRRYQATLYLDEAHALGYFGSEQRPGAGLMAARRKELGDDFFNHAIISAPLGKAPGIMGAFVAGDALLKDYLINRARSFVFSTAQPPILAAMIGSIIRKFRNHEYDHRIESLRNNVAYIRGRIADFNLVSPSDSAIVPIVLGETDKCLRASEHLKEHGMDVRAIRPPTVPEGSSRLRITIHSCHSQKELDRLMELIQPFAGP